MYQVIQIDKLTISVGIPKAVCSIVDTFMLCMLLLRGLLPIVSDETLPNSKNMEKSSEIGQQSQSFC